VNSPTFNLTKLLQENNGDFNAVQDYMNARFLGKELGPVVSLMIDDDILLSHDVVVTNQFCTETVENDDDDDSDHQDASIISPAFTAKPLPEMVYNKFMSVREMREHRARRKRAAASTTKTWPCLYHQTYYTVNRAFFEEEGHPLYKTSISHPNMVGSVTLVPIPNTTVFLLVFQGKLDKLKAEDEIDFVLEPLGHEEVIAQRNVDRFGAHCPNDVIRECLTCPGLNETGFICAGRGDCIDGLCHCPDNNSTPYCLERSSPNAIPSFSLFIILSALVLYCLAL